MLTERVYEDDEMLVENLLLWARDSKNKLLFLDRPDKYMLFWQPETYLAPPGANQDVPLDDEARGNMIEVRHWWQTAKQSTSPYAHAYAILRAFVQKRCRIIYIC